MKNAGRTFVLATGVLAMAGCTNLDGSSNRTATGALVGTGVGALVGRAIDGGGADRHHRRRRHRQHRRRGDRRHRSTGSTPSSRPRSATAAPRWSTPARSSW